MGTSDTRLERSFSKNPLGLVEPERDPSPVSRDKPRTRRTRTQETRDFITLASGKKRNSFRRDQRAKVSMSHGFGHATLNNGSSSFGSLKLHVPARHADGDGHNDVKVSVDRRFVERRSSGAPLSRSGARVSRFSDFLNQRAFQRALSPRLKLTQTLTSVYIIVALPVAFAWHRATSAHSAT